MPTVSVLMSAREPLSSPAAPSDAHWTRRRWLGTAALGLAAAGCDKLNLNRAISYHGEVHALLWSGYFSEEILRTFERRTRIKINVHYFDSNDQLPGLLREKKFPYDLAMPSAFMAKRLLDLGLITGFNRTHLPNLSELDSKTYNPRFDPNNTFVIPYIWGSTGIGYNARRVDGLPKSWADLFRHKLRPSSDTRGKISVLDDARFTIGSVLIYLGFSPSTDNQAEIDAAGEVLMRLRDQIDYFESSNVAKLLADGVVELAMAWSGDVMTALKGDPLRQVPTNHKVRISLPREGSILFKDSFVVPRGGENRAGAEQFINYLLQPDIAAAVTNFSLYATTIPAAKPYVDRLIVNGPSYFIHPAGAEKNFSLEDRVSDEDAYDKLWKQVKAKPAARETAPIKLDSAAGTTPPAGGAPAPAEAREPKQN